MTITEIARLAKVSPPVARKVLNGGAGNNSRVGEVTRQRILSVADRVGYRPNAAARATRTGRFGCIALLSPLSIGGGFLPPALLMGLQNAMSEHDLHLTLAELPAKHMREPELSAPKLLRELLVDGMLLNYSDRLPGIVERFTTRFGTPLVQLNVNEPFDCVLPDDRHGGRWATEKLLRLGHRHITFFVPQSPHSSAKLRVEGYVEAMRDAGLSPEVVTDEAPEMSNLQRVAQYGARLRSASPITAALAYEAPQAGCIWRAAAEMGRKVPRDLSVVAISSQIPSGGGVDIATVHIPMQTVGQEAVNMLLRKIANPAEKLSSIIVPYHYSREGETLAAPASDA